MEFPSRLPIVHTLEAHLPSLSDCPPAKLRRCPAIGTTFDKSRGRVLVAGEPGNGIVEAVAPLAGELLVHKPGKGAFWSTRGLSFLHPKVHLGGNSIGFFWPPKSV